MPAKTAGSISATASDISVRAVFELVALSLSGGPRFVDELRRSWDAGDAVLPLDQRMPPQMQRQLATRLGATVMVDETGRHRCEGGQPVEADDALVMATSGSTGEPKGVVLTHRALAANAAATNSFLKVGPSDRWLACLPLAHVGGLAVVVRALQANIALEVHAGFDAAAVTKAASEGGCTLTSLVPTALGRIDAALFRAILLGGSAMPAQRPSNVIATYGMTETFSGVVYDGWPLAGVELRVCAGEIQIRGEMLLRCYRNSAALSSDRSAALSSDRSAALSDNRSPLTEDGWFATGDSGEISAAGQLSVFGRQDEMIITGGENVWPVAVERVLADAPEVSECAVIGRPHPEWGEVVVAVVAPTDAAQPPKLGALRELVKQSLPAYCAPRELEIVADFARTALGKIQRHLL